MFFKGSLDNHGGNHEQKALLNRPEKGRAEDRFEKIHAKNSISDSL
jgi:hypothetical protein